MSIKSFFEKFVRNNRFNYQNALSDEENFVRLVTHLKLTGKGLETFRKKYENLKKNQLPIEEFHQKYENFYTDFLKVSEVKTIREFFGFFEKKYNFKIFNHDSNFKEKFYSLSRRMKWENIYDFKLRKFEKIAPRMRLEYLNRNLLHYNIDFNIQEGQEINFEKLAENLYWDNYINLFKEKFYELTGTEAENLTKNLESLQNVILRYNLCKEHELPEKINECKSIIKQKLFVNIFDFIDSKSNRKFKNISELRSYSQKNDLIYPLRHAKEHFVYKSLLKQFFNK